MHSFLVRWVVCLLPLLAMNIAHADSTQVFGANEHLAAGARALFMGDYAEGIRLTLKGLKSGGGAAHRASALNNLCAGYAASGQYDEAIRTCTEGLAIRTRNWRIYNNRALAYLGKGQIDAAKRDVDMGLSLSPESRTLIRVQEMVRAGDRRRLIALRN